MCSYSLCLVEYRPPSSILMQHNRINISPDFSTSIKGICMLFINWPNFFIDFFDHLFNMFWIWHHFDASEAWILEILLWIQVLLAFEDATVYVLAMLVDFMIALVKHHFFLYRFVNLIWRLQLTVINWQKLMSVFPDNSNCISTTFIIFLSLSWNLFFLPSKVVSWEMSIALGSR